MANCTDYCEEGSSAVITVNGGSTFSVPGVATACIYEPGEYNPPPQYPDGCTNPGNTEPGWGFPLGNSSDFFRVRGTYELSYTYQGQLYYTYPPGTVWGWIAVRSGPVVGLASPIADGRKTIQLLYGNPVNAFNLLQHDTTDSSSAVITEIQRQNPNTGDWEPLSQSPGGPRPWPQQPSCAMSPVFPGQAPPDPSKWHLEITSSTWNFAVAFEFPSRPAVTGNCIMPCLPCKADLGNRIDKLIKRLG
jgi:hypothetical protein